MSKKSLLIIFIGWILISIPDYFASSSKIFLIFSIIKLSLWLLCSISIIVYLSLKFINATDHYIFSNRNITLVIKNALFEEIISVIRVLVYGIPFILIGFFTLISLDQKTAIISSFQIKIIRMPLSLLLFSFMSAWITISIFSVILYLLYFIAIKSIINEIKKRNKKLDKEMNKQNNYFSWVDIHISFMIALVKIQEYIFTLFKFNKNNIDIIYKVKNSVYLIESKKRFNPPLIF
ncbi:hypothetical protein [Spiroplasma culicicola]|uniref:Transmembrane protein n=1 Tax=Spiroplasma culicicola AES-1 TaxID=1276246 RepID=W6AFS4_9MOLU|nr:hypothetical protein [Spiroplasma culicicola]AHI52559.1 hypothetical protein SCULI_v1c02180 [Spiroplasma culicicola AES-1]